ncbi:Nodulin-like [Trypanosoma melophagium]|uniref:Nodulin-like n=1 Tax=Trypanosoma melophagium TaxID=715481 RepID=UPI003519F5D3|nr:Nodulin-like [Trypanosoma melophagium]
MVHIVDDLCRMRMLMAGVYVGVAISSTYGFSLFTDHLREKYGMSQSDITTISTVGNCVGYCSFLAGMLFDYAGPMVVFPLAGFLGFLGFLLFGLTFDDKIANPTVIHFSIFNAILYLGCPAMDVATVMPLMMQFPMDRGYVVLIQKTFSGLGTSVLMAYFNGWFKSANSDNIKDNNYSGYAYFVGAQILLCTLVGTYFVRLPVYYPCAWRKKRLTAEEITEREGTLELYMKQRAPSRRLKIGFALVVAVLIFSTTQSITTAYVKTSHSGYLAISVVAVLLMASFTAMALPFQFLGRYTPVRPTHMEVIGDTPNTPHDGVMNGDVCDANESPNAKGEEKPVLKPAPQYTGSFWANLLTVDLWAMWIACFGMWGTGTVMQMNAAQIYMSKNSGEKDTPTLTLYITIMAVGSAVGRMSMGFADLKLAQWQRTGKSEMLMTFALPLGSLCLFVAYLFFALLPQQALILPFFLGAFGNGAGWGVGVLAARMMYAKDIGKHYNFLFSSGIVSTIALNRFMFGEMYDAQGRRRGEFPLLQCPRLRAQPDVCPHGCEPCCSLCCRICALALCPLY